MCENTLSATIYLAFNISNYSISRHVFIIIRVPTGSWAPLAIPGPDGTKYGDQISLIRTFNNVLS